MKAAPEELEFLWGAATSSHQIEGYNQHNDWWAWEAAGHVEGGARSGPATDHLNRFKDDLRLAAELGLNSYRFSIEWSRVEPEENRFAADGFEFYRELLVECERLGLVPMVTLHHFTSPLWLAQQGGFTNERTPLHFARYVRRVKQELGARIPLWCTINEPVVLAVGTYLAKIMPPAVFAPELAIAALRQLLRCHVTAYRIIHNENMDRAGPWRDRPLEVGIAHNVLDFVADRRWHPLERVLARVFDQFYNCSFLDAVMGRKQRFSVPGLLPRTLPVSEALGAPTVDFIGINYYSKAYVQWRPKDQVDERPKELPLGVSFARRNEVASDLGWATHPQGLLRLLRWASSYGKPMYITENGIADRNDQLRSTYLTEHLEVIARARSEGLDIRGYYHWSLLDNFEWIKGFWPRFGLYRVNYDTFERTLTDSGRHYRELIRNSRQRDIGSEENDAVAHGAR